MVANALTSWWRRQRAKIEALRSFEATFTLGLGAAKEIGQLYAYPDAEGGARVVYIDQHADVTHYTEDDIAGQLPRDVLMAATGLPGKRVG